ncbi:MAG TPA: diacylglycerol kinase family protein, partial [Bacteroidota bacterium]|nr:diacylglycerol kinase family protein [Bacteroidota bacterium]
QRLERLLTRFGRPHELVRTERPGHATEIARDCVSRVVVAVGGDGTINEVANALAGSGRTIGIIPTGSGNDFIKSVGIPKRMESALELLRLGHERVIDAGVVRTGAWKNGSMEYAPARYFVNGVGAGFDASVARRVGEIRFLRGTPLYLLAVLQTLGRYQSPEFSCRTDSTEWRARKLLIASGNGRCAGGGFYLTPEAEVDDGLLDVCVIDDVSVLKILRLVPRVLAGKLVHDAQVNYQRTKELELSSAERFNVHADGEIVGREVHGVRLKMVASALRIVGP